MARILVLGAGFAGLWAALGAARKRDEIGARAADTEILVIDRNAYHNIRVRNYEVDLADVALPLDGLLDPVGVEHEVAEVAAIDPAKREVVVKTSSGAETLTYDRLVLTTGSELVRPAIPGLAAHGFDVDTHEAAMRLDAHLAALGKEPASPARSTVAVVGAGFTGIEVAAEMSAKLAAAGIAGHHRVILIDPNPVVGATFGAHGRPVINEALSALGVETRLNVRVGAVGADSITLSSGEIIPAATVVWCGGMHASPLAAMLPARRDALGRLAVDHCMRVEGLPGVFAAGDVASCLIDGEHPTVMSCQFARPMGRFAGHNVVADLFGEKLLPLNIDWYVTVLDLGAWGALYTTGWDREVHTTGAAAKLTKQTINQQRIYPPRNGDRAALLAAAAPTIQTAPPTRK
ncbi:FAD-dependent oxidoreductase [Bradyrhizobium viridifuturi]|jgi:NADH:ubiquinone reductase (H+-translocating)|nr:MULTISPECIES: FAD-dependent oxidoreductase [Bradyrhizobium]ERF84960.1 MAG: NADH dehydrogenase [Bradyrhizobium sp. DFCI-1]OYU60101.1 MAG: proton-conducting membrane transporter [Bradyrhizobium sp. PARBB1]PSO26180.1 proton-conducting membrane transporter [Bradyrhizobium sp. MOS004]QRI71830.1 FAD-dependent oxidoreductase [Bradyrhizobium sp. PSBB068]MBR1024268.1 FAD-dependent oxidoreductase [Bradyrhizobium viridifuturi]